MLLKGMLLGFSIAAPVGPIGLLCIQRTLSRGWTAGFASGMGAATADAGYGLVGALGLTAITSAMTSLDLPLRLLGGVFLMWLAWQTWRQQPATQAAHAGSGSLLRDYLGTFALTLSNPMTILSFAAVFAGLGVSSQSQGDAVMLVTGVFIGSALWWLCLATAAKLAAKRLTPQHLLWLNRFAGLVLALFALWALASALPR